MNDSYIAGFFDGEGHAFIGVGHFPLGPRNRGFFGFIVRPQVGITQKQRSILQQIRDYLGYGCFHSARGKSQTVSTLALHSRNAIMFAQRFSNLAIVKRKQLELMVEYGKFKDEIWADWRTISASTYKDQWLKSLDFVERSRELNSHGKEQRFHYNLGQLRTQVNSITDEYFKQHRIDVEEPRIRASREGLARYFQAVNKNPELREAKIESARLKRKNAHELSFRTLVTYYYDHFPSVNNIFPIDIEPFGECKKK